MRLVVEAAVLPQSLEEAAEAVQPVVVAGQLREVRVQEVEDEVVCEQILFAVGEAGADETSDPCHEVQVRPLG
jgi:hypothetical protein